MDKNKRALKGSDSRDSFKLAHKMLPRWFYACDVDLALVDKSLPGIVAVLDFKLEGDIVTFSEIIFYNDILKIARVYIVWGAHPQDGPFRIYEYLGGDPKPDPPVPDLQLVARCKNLDEFQWWENDLRLKARREKNGSCPSDQ